LVPFRAGEYVRGLALAKHASDEIIGTPGGATFRFTDGACLGGPCSNGLVPMPVSVVDRQVRLR